ncbi:MAG TPA: helical backbone metal receptor [Casimicrobiaceae bacterium]|nr:helical backbone metal receptor [Casimicrobiaceae bacterium]
MRHEQAPGAARIACLVPSITETLFALGLGERIVARTGFCVHPRTSVGSVPKIGGTKDVDLDRLRASAPTHLIVNVDENRKEVVELARAFVPHVIVTHPIVPEDNPRLYRLLGAIFACSDHAERLASDFDDALAFAQDTTQALQRESVLYLIWRKPWMTVSRPTYVAATLARVGMDTLPATSERRYPVVADDDRAWRDAQRILLSTEPYAFRARDAEDLQRAKGRPTHLIDGEWTSWYGVRAIEGLRALAAWRRG